MPRSPVLAILSTTEAANSADLLSAELTNQVELQERIQLEELLREQKLSLADSPRLKGVDGAMIVERLTIEENTYYSARLVAVQFGIVLGQWVSADDDLDHWSQAVGEAVSRRKGKLLIDPARAIGISLLNFTPKLVPSEIEAQRSALILRKILVSYLNQLPMIYVLERDRLSDLKLEKSLADVEPKPFQTGTWILDGSWDAPNGPATLEVRFRAPNQEAEVLTATAPSNSYPALAAAIAAVVQKRLAVAETPDSQQLPTGWQPGHESIFFYRESIWLNKLGRIDDAIAACDAALALGANGLPENGGLTFESLQVFRLSLEESRLSRVIAKIGGIEAQDRLPEQAIPILTDCLRLWHSTMQSCPTPERSIQDIQSTADMIKLLAFQNLTECFQRLDNTAKRLITAHQSHSTGATSPQDDLFPAFQNAYSAALTCYLSRTGQTLSFKAIEGLVPISDTPALQANLLNAFKASSRAVRDAVKGDVSDPKTCEEANRLIENYASLLDATGANIQLFPETPTIFFTASAPEDELPCWEAFCDTLKSSDELAEQATAAYLQMRIACVKGGPEAADSYEATLRLIHQHRLELARQNLLHTFANLIYGKSLNKDGLITYDGDYLELRYLLPLWIPVHEAIVRHQPLVETTLSSRITNSPGVLFPQPDVARENPLTRDIAEAFLRPVEQAAANPTRLWIQRGNRRSTGSMRPFITASPSYKQSFVTGCRKRLGLNSDELAHQTKSGDMIPFHPPEWESLALRGCFDVNHYRVVSKEGHDPVVYNDGPGRPLALAVQGEKVSFLTREACVVECDWKRGTMHEFPQLPSIARSAILDAFKKSDRPRNGWEMLGGDSIDSDVKPVGTKRGVPEFVPTGFHLSSHACQIASLQYRESELVLLVQGAMLTIGPSGGDWQLREIPALRGKVGMQFVGDQIVSYLGLLQRTSQGQGIFQVNPVTLEETVLVSSLRRDPRNHLDSALGILLGIAPSDQNKLLVYRGAYPSSMSSGTQSVGWVTELDPQTGQAIDLIGPGQGVRFVPSHLGWNENWSWAVSIKPNASELQLTAIAINRKSNEARLLAIAHDSQAQIQSRLPDKWKQTPGGAAVYSLPRVPLARYGSNSGLARVAAGMDYDGENFLLLGAESIKRQGDVLWWWNSRTGKEPMRIPLTLQIPQPADSTHGKSQSAPIGFKRVQLKEDVLILESDDLCGFCYIPRSELQSYVQTQLSHSGARAAAKSPPTTP